MPYGYPTGQTGGAGETLSGFADTFLKAREQFSREDYRQLQAEQLQRQMDSEKSAEEGFSSLAGQPAAEPMTLAEGVASTPGTLTSTPGAEQQPAGNMQQPTDESLGQPGRPAPTATAPDASLGNTAQTTTATPGKPGLPAIQQQIRTYQDAIQALPGGAKQLADMLKSQQGRQQLRDLGYLSPAEVDQRRQVAEIDQQGRAFDQEIKALAESGKPEDVTAYHFKLAAKYERMAQAAADPNVKQSYRQEMEHQRGLAMDLRADQNTREEAASLRQEFGAAASEFNASGSPAARDAVLAVLGKMQTNKSTATEAQHLLAGFQKRNSDLLGDPDLQGDRRIATAVTTYMHDHPGTSPQDAWATVVKEGARDPQMLAAAIKEATHSGDPAKLVALGLPPKLKSDEYDLALYQTASDGLNPGQSGWADKVTQHLKANHEARTNGTLNTLAARELGDQISALDEQIQDKQQEYDGFKADGTLGTPEAQQAAKDLAALKAERQKRSDLLIQYGGRQGRAGGNTANADERLRIAKLQPALKAAQKDLADARKDPSYQFRGTIGDAARVRVDAAQEKVDGLLAQIQGGPGATQPTPRAAAPTQPATPSAPAVPAGSVLMRTPDGRIVPILSGNIKVAQGRGAVLLDRAPAAVKEGQSAKASNGKLYRNQGGWMVPVQ